MGRITVLAGTNGAGKSSVAGEAFKEKGGTFFNPDLETREILNRYPGLSLEEANAKAWAKSVELLRRAIAEDGVYAFETTLGGNTITGLLVEAAKKGLAVHMWYCGLASPELHIQRVAERVARGGHDIPEKKIRERYDASRRNVIQLLPHLTKLHVYDNSHPVQEGERVIPMPILSVVNRQVTSVNWEAMPDWAKPIVAAAGGHDWLMAPPPIP